MNSAFIKLVLITAFVAMPFLAFFSPPLLVPFMLLAAGLLSCLFLPRAAFLVYTLFCFGFIGIIHDYKFPISEFNLYNTEFAIFLIFPLLAQPKLLKGFFTDRLRIIIFVFSAYGVFSFIYGVAFQGYHFRDAAGNFITYFIIPLVFYNLAVLLLHDNRINLSRVSTLIPYVGFTPVFLITLRSITGHTWATWRYVNVGFRAIAPIEGATLAMLFAYAFMIILRKRPTKQWRMSIVIFVAFVAMILSNYRMNWAGTLLVIALVLVLSRIVGYSYRRLCKPIVVSAIALLSAVAVVFMLPLRPYQSPVNRFQLRVIGFDSLETQHEYIEEFKAKYEEDSLTRELSVAVSPNRMLNWGKAFEVWFASPVIGTGLGYRHVFAEFNSKQQAVLVQRTVHNDYLQMFVMTGSIGGILFLVIHITFTARVIILLRREACNVLAVIPLFIAYLFTCYTALFMPIISLRPNAVIIYSLMAIILSLAGNTDDSLVNTKAISPSGAPDNE